MGALKKLMNVLGASVFDLRPPSIVPVHVRTMLLTAPTDIAIDRLKVEGLTVVQVYDLMHLNNDV